jgi:hypothetical protein
VGVSFSAGDRAPQVRHGHCGDSRDELEVFEAIAISVLMAQIQAGVNSTSGRAVGALVVVDAPVKPPEPGA